MVSFYKLEETFFTNTRLLYRKNIGWYDPVRIRTHYHIAIY